jgi:hypothetical protein
MRRLLTAVIFLMACHSTLRASVCNGAGEAPPPEGLSGDGLRIDHYVVDTPQHRRWAAMMDCAHPERPWMLIAVPWVNGMVPETGEKKPSREAQKCAPLVPAGMKVRLWRIAEGMHVVLSGTALEAGAPGDTIHVRTGREGTVLTGTVRGAGSVELLASGRWRNQGSGSWLDTEKAQ